MTMIALAILWPVLFAVWRWEFGRCALLPRFKIGPVQIIERHQMVLLLGVLALPGLHLLGWAYWLVCWAALALYWTKGHNWESWSALLLRYGPPGLVYRAAFNWWPERWVDGKYFDGPEAVARVGIGFLVGLPFGAMWLLPGIT